MHPRRLISMDTFVSIRELGRTFGEAGCAVRWQGQGGELSSSTCHILPHPADISLPITDDAGSASAKELFNEILGYENSSIFRFGLLFLYPWSLDIEETGGGGREAEKERKKTSSSSSESLQSAPPSDVSHRISRGVCGSLGMDTRIMGYGYGRLAYTKKPCTRCGRDNNGPKSGSRWNVEIYIEEQGNGEEYAEEEEEEEDRVTSLRDLCSYLS
uniref:Uncharacterized protein n=1 Tax=Vespula pensylvanica TaxID=30213 RepID=A0A834NY48_VESPE|nr:hypothetical protein H0235_009220 [Vespula pensylvanica]